MLDNNVVPREHFVLTSSPTVFTMKFSSAGEVVDSAKIVDKPCGFSFKRLWISSMTNWTFSGVANFVTISKKSLSAQGD